MKGLRLEKGCDLLQVSSFVISLRPLVQLGVAG